MHRHYYDAVKCKENNKNQLFSALLRRWEWKITMQKVVQKDVEEKYSSLCRRGRAVTCHSENRRE